MQATTLTIAKIPAGPLVLGFAGLIPFLWGAATAVSPALAGSSVAMLGPRAVGLFLLVSYGTVILAFMSGVLWGFGTRAPEGQASACYALSVIPALWAFFAGAGEPTGAAIRIAFGFLALLLLDAMFARWDLTPAWWMRLRIVLTSIVVICLGIGALA